MRDPLSPWKADIDTFIAGLENYGSFKIRSQKLLFPSTRAWVIVFTTKFQFIHIHCKDPVNDRFYRQFFSIFEGNELINSLAIFSINEIIQNR